MKSIRITIFFFSLLIGVFLLLGWRCFYLQYYKHAHYSEISLNQQRALKNVQPQRGIILDSRGRILAASNGFETIFVEPRIFTDIDDTKDVSNQLAEIVDIPAHKICQMILESGNPGYIAIKNDADPNECEQARKIRGVGVQTNWRRNYPMGSLVAHIVGFTSRDNFGLEGIELKYDEKLRGSAMQNTFLADSRRRPIRLKEKSGQLADGVGIILTIDATIQQFARDELIKQYKSFEAESATAVVVNPKTGAILAMVSVPDFDPNDYQSSDPNNLRNRVLTDPFEPGSMIKPIVAAIAVDNGTIKKDDVIFCENGDYYDRKFGRINEYRTKKYGNLKIRNIIIKSSNIGMAKIGQKMGAQKLYDGLALFGFGNKVGIELPGEVEGLVRPVSKWDGFSVTRIPYGYEINVTALQMIQAYSILANGGRFVKPHLVKAIVNSDGDIEQVAREVPPVGYVIKREVAEWMVNDCLVGVINERSNGGTGWRAKLDKWQLFGKTGTANISRVGQEGYEDNSNLASFIAGAPVEDPKVLVLVSIRKPNGKLGKGDSGGAVASPVVGKIIEKTLTYLENR